MLSTDFDEQPTRVDLEAPTRIWDRYMLERRIAFHKACWELDEFKDQLKARATNFSDDFGVDAKTVEVTRP